MSAPTIPPGLLLLAIYGYFTACWQAVRFCGWLAVRLNAPHWRSGTITGVPLYGVAWLDGSLTILCGRRTLFVARAATPHPRETPEPNTSTDLG